MKVCLEWTWPRKELLVPISLYSNSGTHTHSYVPQFDATEAIANVISVSPRTIATFPRIQVFPEQKCSRRVAPPQLIILTGAQSFQCSKLPDNGEFYSEIHDQRTAKMPSTPRQRQMKRTQKYLGLKTNNIQKKIKRA